MSEFIDIAVVGAGPCGIAVGAAAAQSGLGSTLYDKGCITNSLVDYPYYMTFFSTARKLEIASVPPCSSAMRLASGRPSPALPC